MPELGGVNTCHMLKNINPKVRVLVTSGYALDSNAHQLMENENIEFIAKPYEMSDISEKIKKLIAS